MSRRNEITVKETTALQLRSQGRRLDEIAAELGYADASGAYRAIERALRKHQTVGVEEYRAMSSAQLDELDAQAAAITAMPGVGAGDLLKAIETRRKIVLSRGEVLGMKAAQQAGNGPGEGVGGNDLPFPEAGSGTITILNLSNAPTDVLPEDLEAIGVVPEGIFVIGINPDWQPERLVRTFAAEGRLLRGNVLFTATDIGPWLEWLREEREARWAAQNRKPASSLSVTPVIEGEVGDDDA